MIVKLEKVALKVHCMFSVSYTRSASGSPFNRSDQHLPKALKGIRIWVRASALRGKVFLPVSPKRLDKVPVGFANST